MDILKTSILNTVAKHFALLISYVLVARVMLGIFAANGVVSIVWPSSGIAFAALLLGGRQYIPGILLAVLLVSLWAGNSLLVSLGISIGNTLEAVVAFELFRRCSPDNNLLKPRDYFCIAIAGSIASVLAAVGGTLNIWFAGYIQADQVAENIWQWWQGDVLGIILIAPLILVWRTLPQGWFKREHITETLLFFLLMVLCGQAVFHHWFADQMGEYVQPYWMFLFVVWAAVSFGRHGVLLVMFITAVQFLSGILYEVGLVDSWVTENQMQNFWFFMIVLSIVGITLALVIFQRRHDQDELISLKEKAEQAVETLHESEERHRILFEYSKDALMTSEPPLNAFTSGNREALLMFGVKDEKEFTRYGPLDFSPEYQPDGKKSIDKAMAVMSETIKTGSSYFEWVHCRMNGEEFPCSILLTAITIHGRVVIQAAVRDITLQKQAEKSLKDMNEQLERRVEERTRELEEAKSMAEAMAHEKGEFLANMSHEIRVPISSVLGMSYLALRTTLSAKQRDYVEKIQVSAQHLLSLIDSILDFSKLEAGQVILENIDFTLSQVVDTMNTLVIEKAANKGMDVIVNIDNDVPVDLQGDPLRLAQILINYVNNAVKFSEHGDIVVHISQSKISNEEVMLRFEVADQGVGIPLQEQSKLFESFRQGDPSITRKYGGSGLGLAICKQLAGMMGGSVGLNSTPGEGSTFWFTAKLGFANSLHQDMIAGKISEQSAFSRQSLNGARILVAEDNPINQQVAYEILQLAGAHVEVANNGREAIEWLHQQPFDCVLMDIQMPDMDGLQSTQAIRADSAISDVIVIAMTANAWNEDQQRCLDAGMDDFVSKPVKPSHLYAVISKWLEKKGIHGSEVIEPNRQINMKKTPSSIKKRIAETGDELIDPEIINLDILAECLGNDREQLLEFVQERFLPSTYTGLNEMHEALKAQDREALCTLGHKYKSSAKTVGAMGFANLCFAMEKLPEEQWQEKAENLLQEMRQLLDTISSVVSH